MPKTYMNNSGKGADAMEQHYFLTTNGSKQKTSYLKKALAAYRDVILLSGYPRKTAAKLIHEYYTIAKQNRMDIEILHNCLDNGFEGILLPELGTGLVNLPIYEERFDVSALFKNDFSNRFGQEMQKAYENFEAAKRIHDDWEKIYIDATDYETLNLFTEETIQKLIPSAKTGDVGKAKDRFFGAATINGSFDYINSLSEGCKRYFIKGRPGSGKSTFLKKIVQAVVDSGYTVERYHCSFDPDSLDMVIIRALQLCLFDSTSPHEYFPTQSDDEILDLYALAVRPGTDEANADALQSFAERYKSNIESAVKHMITANELCIRYEEELQKQLSDDKIMEVRKAIMARIFPA